jgi:putative CocE/NonD family hydrolase
VLAYETGADEWHQYDAWPQSCAQDCKQKSHSLYLLSGGRLAFDKAGSTSQFDEYISDPAKPVPYRASRPTLWGSAENSTWGEWLADDQRNAAARPDVLVYESEPLTAPVRAAGQPIAHLFASTSGTDSDWVVKIIDVWPDEVPDNPKMGGYQQMISADIFRGRYREDFAKPTPLKANAAFPYDIRLPQMSHTFLPGHRVMVQIQSSWFPLYDRNPQTFVPNIMFAKPADFQKATQRIWHTAEQPSAIELPVIE